MKAVTPLPVCVTVSGVVVIGLRCLDLILLLHVCGWSFLVSYATYSWQEWQSGLLFLSAFLLLCFQIVCGSLLIKGYMWGRWGYLVSQLIIAFYAFLSVFTNFEDDLFSIEGDTPLSMLLGWGIQKLPDFIVLVLLFLAPTSRRYFNKIKM